ncbi:MAG TPA: pantetheine-phosphate adenylyltransferase [Acidimicrobiales bacterium]|nr:pantetheine-phosphate adenylyltransferase [Acidimicrobiales bacterium]
MTSAIFPGSFDPFHNGHYEIVERAHRVFDRVVVAVLQNSAKGDPLFAPKEREEIIATCLAGFPNVEVVSMSTLVVDVARTVGADVIVRGLRAVSDFENELQMAQMNHELSGIETLFVPTGATYSFISSRLVREVASLGGDVTRFVPPAVALAMSGRFGD